MFEIVVFSILVIVAGGALYALWRMASQLGRRADDMEAAAPSPPPERARVATGVLGPDGTVYLCAHEFVPPGAPRQVTNVRRRAYAPLTGAELEPRRVAEQVLYAVLASHIQSGDVKPSIADCEPSLMPPFPHKCWTLELGRERRLEGSPTAEALDCAFDLIEQRRAKRRGEAREGVPLDELIEDMLKVMRQEMSFWDRAGVYADIRQYVEAALVDEGYLVAPQRETLLERLRHLRPTVSESVRPKLEPAARQLAERLAAFRRAHGSSAAAEADSVPGGRVEEVDESIVEAQPPFEDLPLHDCLHISIHEALLAIRQLEPSEDVGV
jgi:hypothetical protein